MDERFLLTKATFVNDYMYLLIFVKGLHYMVFLPASESYKTRS